MQVPIACNGQICSNYLQKCRLTWRIRPPTQRRRPARPAGRRPDRPLHHRGRGTRPQPHHHLSPHRRTRAVDRWPGAGPGRRRLGAHRSRTRGAVGRRGRRIGRSLTDRRAGRRRGRWKAWCGYRRPTASPPTSPRRPPPRCSGSTRRSRSRSSPPPGAPPSSVPGSTSRWWSASPRSTAPRRSGWATTASASTAPATTSPSTARRRASTIWQRYPLVYFIDSMLQVDDLDLATSFAPAMRESVTSTNVFVHVEATRAAAGLGLLPCFMADRHDDLVRVLPTRSIR